MDIGWSIDILCKLSESKCETSVELLNTPVLVKNMPKNLGNSSCFQF